MTSTRRALTSLLFFALAACDGGKSGGDLTVSDLTVGGCGGQELRTAPPADSGDTAGPETLTVTPAGPGTIEVLHQNVPDACCVEHEVITSVSGDALTIVYESSGDPCDCMCSYDFSYTLSGLTTGDWVVEAAGSSATVTVE